MGNPSAEPNPNPNPTTSITHFSHPHPLHLLNPQALPQILSCSACMLDVAASASASDSSAAVYACFICNFALHPKCSQLPQQIQHPFDRKHALTLYPKPVYPEGLFNCDACGNRGAGFSYHCSPCGVDLHTTCASLPMSLSHHCHRDPLSLTFSAPYPGNRFSCDICKKLGSKTWIYRCAACEFDVHLQCVATVVPVAPAPQVQPHVIRRTFVTAPAVQPPNVGGYGSGGGGGAYGPQQPAVAANAYPAVGTPAYGNVNQPVYSDARPANSLADQLAAAAVGGVAEAATQAIFQSVFGIGGGGGGGGGGDVSRVDVVGMDGGGAAFIDGGSFGDGGFGGADGGFSGGDESY